MYFALGRGLVDGGLAAWFSLDNAFGGKVEIRRGARDDTRSDYWRGEKNALSATSCRAGARCCS